jgi:hypothetical protein
MGALMGSLGLVVLSRAAQAPGHTQDVGNVSPAVGHDIDVVQERVQ